MPQSEDALAWVTLARAPGLGAAALAAALAKLGTAQAILAAPASLATRAGLPASVAAFLAQPDSTPTAIERRWLEHPRHHLVPFNDERFPPLLLAIDDCPIALYVDGDAQILREPQLAIVGSRNPTPQGREHAFEFAECLVRRGLTITSGLAEGIDAEAHHGALAGQGLTLAVLGTGIDVIYPRGNASLAAQIALYG